MGLTKSGVGHRVAQGRLLPIHAGIYAVGHRVVSARGWWMAAVLGGGPGALLCGRSAAALLGLVDGTPAITDVLVLRGASRLPHVRQHRVRAIGAQDRTTVDGIPCTAVARTLLDLARTESERTVDRAVRRAVELDLFDRFAVDEVLARGRKGTVLLRGALGMVAEDLGTGRLTKHELELRFLELLRRHAFVLPETNVLVATPRRDWEVDASWPALRLVVELDGWWTHRDREAFTRDHQRGADVRAAGFEVVRLCWDQVVDDEAGTIELLDLLVPRLR
jgi:hypothetical protein